MIRRGVRCVAALGDRQGVAMIEFALTLPVMLILYLGGVQLQDGIACNRKVTIATRAAGDLISQNTTGTISASEVDDDLQLATQVLLPYAASAATIRVTEIAIANGQATVKWSRGLNTTRYNPGSRITVPNEMLAYSSSYLLFAEVTYAYTPPSSFGAIGPLTLKDSLYMIPRNTDQIDCTDCQ
ncbi:TadE/TadG family type IV pilus assembly protein [Sphingomonas sp. SORGH_AS_0879]|uniref:TadE/TadG family type IV pilus assembly protein n=2 Tax=unclassified Sphingomonas TaxID=196159 RepID=UPI002784B6D2|nr:TadE/TadG family type IV pilus assembly protein [Sphingomonas sp. SORGH_AS_0879]MDQ1229360.1 Flp pilus assembly protein TadG [Sphingomonas sp. SORGH_AS_0879]